MKSNLALLLLAASLSLSPGQAPSITQSPASQTIFHGDPVTFRVTASGAVPLSYQWFRNDLPLPAATASAYTINFTSQTDHDARFAVRVVNSSGAVTSAVAVLTIDGGIPGPPVSQRVLSYTNVWKYNQTQNLDGTNWTASGFNDGAWPSGPGLLAAENNSSIAPLIRTSLLAPNAPPAGLGSGHAYYFRTPAVFTNNFIVSGLQLTWRCDDGAVLYTNGSEALRIRMLDGVITNLSFATGFPPGGTSDATTDESRAIPGAALARGTNIIAVSVHQANSTSSDIVWGLALDVVGYERLRDTESPAVSAVYPEAGSNVLALREIEVHFSEPVLGVKPGDLLINGLPATNIVVYGPEVYLFQFPPKANGQIAVAWSTAHQIVDRSASSNRFAGGSFTYNQDPAWFMRQVAITEFMAGNQTTIRDEDGSYSDWIELYNTGTTDVSLGGWYLTTNPASLTQWRVPDGVTLAPSSYLLVWASGKDRAIAGAPLHTNFRLNKSAGAFLGLVLPDGVTVASSFIYPQQFDDVSYGRDRAVPTLTGYFTNATPGLQNATIGSGFAPEVKFSRPGGTFEQPFDLVLSTADPNVVIRYFLVTNAASAALTDVPNLACPVYTGPIYMTNNAQVRARAFPTQAGVFPGPPASETYLRITPGAAAFTSQLPIVIFHNFNGGTPPASIDQSAVMMVFEPKFGLASLTNPPDTCTRIGINIRGSSTEGLAKKSFGVEAWDEFNEDTAVELAGLPAESDWVFYAPNGYDKPLIHNPLIHDLSRQIGRYSPRVRMVEVFTSFTSGPVGYSPPAFGQYGGVYVLEEKIKADNQRVDIPRLQPEETNAPAITGGYILKIDRVDPDERTLSAAGLNMVYVEPGMSDYAMYPGRVLQDNYLAGYFNSFYAALTGSAWTNPATGYAAWIDVPSWIDHHILNVLALNSDSLRLSAFFFKNRGQKLEMGPLWDFDRSMGANDGNDWRSWNPRTWTASNPLGGPTGTDYGTDYFNSGNMFSNPWYSRLLRDPNFWQQWIDRYQQLRANELSDVSLLTAVDRLTHNLGTAQAREAAKWPGPSTPRSGFVSVPAGWPDVSYTHIFTGTYQGEIVFLKKWLLDRVNFMDTNFLARPTLSRPGGPVSAGAPLTLTPASRSGTILYYTLNGTDPRLPGGAISSSALSSAGPLTLPLNQNVRVFARSYNSNHRNLTGARNPPISSPWSGPTIATFYVAVPPLRVTEIMYHPPPFPAGNTNNPADAEFIELKNISGASLNLQNFRLGGGIDFTFPNLTLGAGQHVVAVRNVTAFQSRYGSGPLIAGVYTNNLANDGDRIILEGPLQEPILDFDYHDEWYPATDGLGFSLVIRDASAPTDSWNQKPAWRPSAVPSGTPGSADPEPAGIPPVRINEALTHTDPPQSDTVELFNPTGERVDLSGWVLTDDPRNPAKFRIPADTFIPPGGYITFDQTHFNTGPQPFALSSAGETIYLFSAGTNTNLTGYSHGFDFGAAPNGVSFGRFLNGAGNERFVLQSRNSLATRNAYPRVGPLVITEIMHYPPDLPFGENNSLEEYLELQNISGTNLPLYHLAAPTNTWRLRGAVDFDFPANVVLAPATRLLLVSFDPQLYPHAKATFVAKYGVPDGTPIFGPWTRKLSNTADTIQLEAPDNPNVMPDSTLVPYFLVEQISYETASPWPAGANGTGLSLQRIDPNLFGDDPTNWQAGTPSAGQSNPSGPPPDVDGDGLPDAWELANGLDPSDSSGDYGGSGDPDGDGASNFQEFMAGTDPQNPLDFLAIIGVAVTNATCYLEFEARSNRGYVVEYLPTLNPGETWQPLTNVVSGNPGRLILPLPATDAEGFYRLKIAP